MDSLEISLEIKDGNAEVVIGKNKQLLQDFIDTAAKAQPELKFRVPNENYINLDKLEKRALETRKQFEQLAATRLDGGNVGNLTKEVVRASERSRQLETDIANIKRELLNPNRKSSIAFLTDELRAAEKEADQLSRKLSALPSSGTAGGGARGGRGNVGTDLSNFQKTNLGYQLNDVVTGLASGQNPSQILAQQGGQIAQIFSTEQITAFTAAYGGLVSILGLGTVAIAATYKITGDIRAEAERLLKVEESLVGASNRRILATQKILENERQTRIEAQNNFEFQQRLQNNKNSDLKRERDFLLQQNNLLPETVPVIINGKVEAQENEQRKANFKRILDLENQIRQNDLTNTQSADEAFNQRFDSFQKNQEKNRLFEIEAAKKSEADRKKREEDVEKAKTKIKELERQYLSTFDALFQKSAANNPFVTIFTDSDKALRELKENLRGLPAELQAVAIKMQQQFNLRKLLEAGVDNKLSVFDLREQSQNFRNPFDGDKQKKDQDEFISRFLKNNPNYLFLEGKNSLDEETRAKILKRFAPSSLNETPADRLNKSLDDKFNLLFKPGQTAEQQAIADKRFISATAGANPLDLTKDLREKAAVVREREAIRQERYQQDALQIYRDQREYQKQIAENTKRQNEIGAKGGTKALELTLKDETSSGNAQLQSAPTARDTSAAYFDPDFDSLNNRGTLTNRR